MTAGPDIVRQAKIVAARHCASISGLLAGWILPEHLNAGQTMSGVRVENPSSREPGVGKP
jgi:hypothetical protein